MRDLEKVRKTSVSIDDEETEEGLVCYGAPIFDWNEDVIAAISVSAPLARMMDLRSDNAIRMVTQAASNITKLIAGLKK